jgi:hypothetical protein
MANATELRPDVEELGSPPSSGPAGMTTSRVNKPTTSGTREREPRSTDVSLGGDLAAQASRRAGSTGRASTPSASRRLRRSGSIAVEAHSCCARTCADVLDSGIQHHQRARLPARGDRQVHGPGRRYGEIERLPQDHHSVPESKKLGRVGEGRGARPDRCSAAAGRCRKSWTSGPRSARRRSRVS